MSLKATPPKDMTPEHLTPEEMVSRLLYRDGLMLIIDKPAGLAVHKGPKGGASLEDYFDALRFGLPRTPALAHRLDKETSGCLVLGRHRKALADLSDLFRHGKVGKTYWAVVEGGPAEAEGRIDLPLGRLDDNRGWWMKHDPDGLPSSTHVEGDGAARRRALHAGSRSSRSPAGRISCACIARRWAGRSSATTSTAPRRAHGGAAPATARARESRCRSTRTAPPIKVTAPVPLHMHERLKACGWNEDERQGPLSGAHARACAPIGTRQRRVSDARAEARSQ